VIGCGVTAIGLAFGIGQLIGGLGWIPFCQLGNGTFIGKAQVAIAFLRVGCAQIGVRLPFLIQSLSLRCLIFCCCLLIT
jgi:hypothetical protein